MTAPNPRNCSTCEHATIGEKVFCSAPAPLWVPHSTERTVTEPDRRCDAHKVAKGTFARICLNCGSPIRTHHKYTQLGQDQWIHKCCKYPDSYSEYHHRQVCKAQGWQMPEDTQP